MPNCSFHQRHSRTDDSADDYSYFAPEPEQRHRGQSDSLRCHVGQCDAADATDSADTRIPESRERESENPCFAWRCRRIRSPVCGSFLPRLWPESSSRSISVLRRNRSTAGSIPTNSIRSSTTCCPMRQKYTPDKGEIIIRIETGDDCSVCISVANSGELMTQQTIDGLFSPVLRRQLPETPYDWNRYRSVVGQGSHRPPPRFNPGVERRAGRQLFPNHATHRSRCLYRRGDRR